MYWCGPSTLATSVFSVPFCEQPGQPHHERAHPGPLGGYRLLLEWVFFRLILILLSPVLLYFLQGRRPPEWNFTSPLCSKRNCTQPQSGLHLRKSKGLSHFSTVSSLCLYPQSGESKARDQLLHSTKGEGGVCGGQSVSRFP